MGGETHKTYDVVFKCVWVVRIIKLIMFVGVYEW